MPAMGSSSCREDDYARRARPAQETDGVHEQAGGPLHRRLIAFLECTHGTETAAAGRLDHENIAGVHFDGARRAELLANTLGRGSRAVAPVASERARRSTADAERRYAPVVGEHHRRHRLEKAHAPLRAVAPMMPALAAAPPPPRGTREAHRASP